MIPAKIIHCAVVPFPVNNLTQYRKPISIGKKSAVKQLSLTMNFVFLKK